MVDRIAAPEFMDDPRPRLNDIRAWPVIGMFLALFFVLALGIFWITGEAVEPAEERPDRGNNMIADAAPIPGFPTDYTQIEVPPPAPIPEPEPDKPAAPGAPPPPAAPAPAPAPAPSVVAHGGGGRSWRQEAREGETKLVEVNREGRGGASGGSGAMMASSAPPGGSGAPGAAPGGGNGIYSSARLTGPMPGQVNARTPIRAHTEQPIATDAPGYVTALTIGDVWTADKSCVAIPHGSRLYGETMGEVSEGQVKVTTIWTHLQRPLPRNDSIELTKVVGSDRDGTPGIRGKVNNHWLRKFGFIVASSAIDIGTAALGGRGGNRGTVVIGGTIAENARSPLDDFAKKQLDIPPTIEVEPKEISVMLSQHLPLDCFR